MNDDIILIMLNINQRKSVFIFIFLDFVLLAFYANFLDISYAEYEYVFESKTPISFLLIRFFDIFGKSNLTLRLPFVLVHTINVVLLYIFSTRHLKNKNDALLSVFLYMLLPGVNSSALIVESSGFIIFGTLLFLNIYDKNKQVALFFLLCLSPLHRAFLLLSFSMIFSGLYRKNASIIAFSVASFVINYYFFGFDVGSKPKGYFLDVFGVYAAIFSPLVFFYFIYSLYWYLFRKKEILPNIWFISFVAFVLSVMLSLRQDLRLEDFAAFSVIATPFMIRTFLNSLRVRLPEHRKKIKILFFIVFVSLVLNTGLTFFNKPIYLLIKYPYKHFAFDFHFAKELAKELQELGIRKVTTNTVLQKRLWFYGIEEGGKRLDLKKFTGSKTISFKIIADKKIYYFLEQ